MKKLLIFALAVAPALCAAQLVTEEAVRPNIRLEFGGDGSTYRVVTLYGDRNHVNIPFGLDFEAGWSILIGKRTHSMEGLFSETPALGLELSVTKSFTGELLGSGKPFLQLSLRMFMDADEPDGSRTSNDFGRFRATFVASAGWKID